MPMTTYCHPQRNCGDPDIQELLNDANKVSCQEIVVQRRPIVRKKLFRSPEIVGYTHELLIDVSCGCEWQVINFPPADPSSKWSINPAVSKQTIMAWLYGFLAAGGDRVKDQQGDDNG